MMHRPLRAAMTILLAATLAAPGLLFAGEAAVALPPPRLDGGVSVGKALLERRSVRSYGAEPLSLAEVSQLLWAVPQPSIGSAPAALLITGRTAKAREASWVYLEAGHAAQNVCLQAVSLKLGTVTMAGFKPDVVKKELRLPDGEQPIYVMPVGRK